MWTGFYVGLNAGYTWGATDGVSNAGYGLVNGVDVGVLRFLNHVAASAGSVTGETGANSSGYIGGAQVGYNYQWGNSLILGLEADIQGADLRGKGSFVGAGATAGGVLSDFLYSGVEHKKTVDWLGTLRGRVGYLVTPTFLAYATGGLAYGGVSATTHISQGWGGAPGNALQTSGAVGSFADTRVGWTVGGGLEWLFAPNWSVKAEYLYYDLGSAQWTSGPALTTLSFGLPAPTISAIATQSQTRFDGHVARVGLNYHFNGAAGSDISGADLVSKIGPSAAPPPAWTGLYAGLSAGYAWGASDSVSTTAYGVSNSLDAALTPLLGRPVALTAPAALSATGSAGMAAHGFLGGAQAGYNYQLGSSFVVGLEADIQGGGIRGRGSFLGAAAGDNGVRSDAVLSGVDHEKSVDWLGTVRGRVGYLATQTLLAFATGGLAYGGVSASSHVSQMWSGDSIAPGLQTTGAAGSLSDTRVGWTVGGGLEWMFMPDWSVKAEYLYFDLGAAAWNSSLAGTLFNTNAATLAVNLILPQSHTRFNGHIVRAGVNYHFNFGSAPTVAGY
jgi:opacity protein-like surface antigen